MAQPPAPAAVEAARSAVDAHDEEEVDKLADLANKDLDVDMEEVQEAGEEAAQEEGCEAGEGEEEEGEEWA